jgi:hypothetical protein
VSLAPPGQIRPEWRLTPSRSEEQLCRSSAEKYTPAMGFLWDYGTMAPMCDITAEADRYCAHDIVGDSPDIARRPWRSWSSRWRCSRAAARRCCAGYGVSRISLQRPWSNGHCWQTAASTALVLPVPVDPGDVRFSARPGVRMSWLLPNCLRGADGRLAGTGAHLRSGPRCAGSSMVVRCPGADRASQRPPLVVRANQDDQQRGVGLGSAD